MLLVLSVMLLSHLFIENRMRPTSAGGPSAGIEDIQMPAFPGYPLDTLDKRTLLQCWVVMCLHRSCSAKLLHSALPA